MKNAPVEDAYAKNVNVRSLLPLLRSPHTHLTLCFVRAVDVAQITFHPLGKEIRNVRCMRCGVWGHRSGDRECAMKDQNPNDASRLLREDPMTSMKVGTRAHVDAAQPCHA